MKNRIKEIRKEKKITQQELVDDLDITRQYISLIEKKREVRTTVIKGGKCDSHKIGSMYL